MNSIRWICNHKLNDMRGLMSTNTKWFSFKNFFNWSYQTCGTKYGDFSNFIFILPIFTTNFQNVFFLVFVSYSIRLKSVIENIIPVTWKRKEIKLQFCSFVKDWLTWLVTSILAPNHLNILNYIVCNFGSIPA